MTIVVAGEQLAKSSLTLPYFFGKITTGMGIK
jgi:hypothetical protein